MSELSNEFDRELEEEMRKKRVRYTVFGVVVVITVIVLTILVFQRIEEKNKRHAKDKTSTSQEK
jgi:hypothetical protein